MLAALRCATKQHLQPSTSYNCLTQSILNWVNLASQHRSNPLNYRSSSLTDNKAHHLVFTAASFLNHFCNCCALLLSNATFCKISFWQHIFATAVHCNQQQAIAKFFRQFPFQLIKRYLVKNTDMVLHIEDSKSCPEISIATLKQWRTLCSNCCLHPSKSFFKLSSKC